MPDENEFFRLADIQLSSVDFWSLMGRFRTFLNNPQIKEEDSVYSLNKSECRMIMQWANSSIMLRPLIESLKR
jgi:hypothetical protein